ncbi:MAG TPA: hypothetical protein VHO28_12060 [Ignavibacteriales bacterium]|nr:hypothetical protein [Ignavibacteriales bacterium]
MEFNKLYDKYILLWPEIIDLSDSYPVQDDGYMFPLLNEIYSNLEDNAADPKDGDYDWVMLFIWACFAVFHSNAKKNVTKGIYILETRKVEKEVIDKRIRENLEEESWKDSAKLYIPYKE